MQILKKISLFLIFCFTSLIIVFLCSRGNLVIGFGLSLVPLLFVALYFIMKDPFWGLILSFTVNYFIMGVTRYIPSIPGGIVFDLTLVILLFSMLVNTIGRKVDWSKGINIASIVALIWMLYCFLEFFNPQAVSNTAWFRTIRGIAVYFFLMVFITCILCKEYRQFRILMMLWAVFTIIGVTKALIQKFIGFDFYEKMWLYQGGGATTHIIYSGIRYFSFFTDAASFGASMGQSMVVFGGMALFEKKKKIKYFYLAVSLLATYGLLISGTRAAIAVPFVGFAIYIFLSKNIRSIVIFSAILLSSIVFLKFTTYGEGNAIIRRTRSVFNVSEDASFLVRLENQKKLREYLSDKPFGAGIGHGGVKAKEPTNNSYLSQIPTDSWYVMVWVETGIVGLVLNVTVMVIILLYGCYLSLFVLKDKRTRGMTSSLIGGVAGIMVASYANEILGQFPIGVITYTSIGFIILSRKYDEQLSKEGTVALPDNG